MTDYETQQENRKKAAEISNAILHQATRLIPSMVKTSAFQSDPHNLKRLKAIHSAIAVLHLDITKEDCKDREAVEILERIMLLSNQCVMEDGDSLQEHFSRVIDKVKQTDKFDKDFENLTYGEMVDRGKSDA